MCKRKKHIKCVEDECLNLSWYLSRYKAAVLQGDKEVAAAYAKQVVKAAKSLGHSIRAGVLHW